MCTNVKFQNRPTLMVNAKNNNLMHNYNIAWCYTNICQFWILFYIITSTLFWTSVIFKGHIALKLIVLKILLWRKLTYHWIENFGKIDFDTYFNIFVMISSDGSVISNFFTNYRSYDINWKFSLWKKHFEYHLHTF